MIALLFMAASAIRAGDAPGDNNTQTSGTASPGPDNGIFVYKLAGDGQMAPAGQWTPASLEAGVWDENGVRPLSNVPVDFSLVEGGGWLARTPGLDAGAHLQILTDIDGIAQIWHRQPDQAGVQSLIKASALGKSVTFTTYSLEFEVRGPFTDAPGAKETPASSFNPSATETTPRSPPTKPALREMLSSLVSNGDRRNASRVGQEDSTSQNKKKLAPDDCGLPDAYFAYPADHPLGRMQRGMLLYAAACKARELRKPDAASLLAADAKEWLLLALESEGGSGMSAASVSRCLYYLGQIAERYEGRRAEALSCYREAAKKDATRKHAKTAAERIDTAGRIETAERIAAAKRAQPAKE